MPQRPDDPLSGQAFLQVIPALVEGGAERACVEIADGLARAGALPLVAASGGPLEQAIRAVGGEIVLLPLKTKAPWRLLANAGRLTGLIHQRGIRLIHARSRAPAWSALYAARRMGIPLVTTVHAPYGAGSTLKSRYNSVMVKGAAVIAISSFVRDWIGMHYPAALPRVQVILRPVDAERFDPAAPDLAERCAALRTRLSLPPDRPMILLPGRITRWKGQDLLLQAMARARPEAPLGQAVAVLAGSAKDGERFQQDLQDLAQRLSLTPRIRFAGSIEDLPAALALADVVVSTSREPEGFGRVVAEALAMGRPVIAPDHGGAREILAPGAPGEPMLGHLVPPEDPAALTAALEALLQQGPEARAAAGARARAVMRQRYDLRRMQAETLDLYRRVLAEPRPESSGRP